MGYDSILLRHRLSTSWNSEVGSRKVDYQGSRAHITGTHAHTSREGGVYLKNSTELRAKETVTECKYSEA